jgi:beta-lactamase class A
MKRTGFFIFAFWLLLMADAGVCFSIADRIALEARDFPGRIGLCARHLGTGEEIHYRSSERFPTASSIKTCIMAEFFCQQAEGLISLDDPCVILEEEKIGGSGTLQDATGEVKTDYRKMIELMITISDNTATNECIDGIGGLWDGIYAMNGRMKRYGLHQTNLLNKMMWYKTKTRSPDSLRYGVGVSSPVDMVLLYERLYRGLIVDRAASDAMLDVLKRQKYHSMIPGQLPGDTIPPIVVAHKTGSVGDAVGTRGLFTRPGGLGHRAVADGTDEAQWQRMLAGQEPLGIPSVRSDWPGEKAAVEKLRLYPACVRLLLYRRGVLIPLDPPLFYPL